MLVANNPDGTITLPERVGASLSEGLAMCDALAGFGEVLLCAEAGCL